MCIFVLVFLSYPYFPSLPAFPRIPFKPKERKDTNARGKERVRAQRALMRSLTPPPPSLLQSINKKLKPGSQLSPSTCTDLFHCSCHFFSFLHLPFSLSLLSLYLFAIPSPPLPLPVLPSSAHPSYLSLSVLLSSPTSSGFPSALSPHLPFPPRSSYLSFPALFLLNLFKCLPSGG